MPRLQPINPATAQGETAAVLNGVAKKLGKVPNIIATMANSPAVANAYLSFSGALAGGSLPANVRERIALTTGQANQCDYCVAAHTVLGKGAGLSDEDVADARNGTAKTEKEAAAVVFARKVVETQGNVSDADVTTVREAGYTDGEIAEIVAGVSLNLFTNYFNHVAGTEIDFPAAPELASV